MEYIPGLWIDNQGWVWEGNLRLPFKFNSQTQEIETMARAIDNQARSTRLVSISITQLQTAHTIVRD